MQRAATTSLTLPLHSLPRACEAFPSARAALFRGALSHRCIARWPVSGPPSACDSACDSRSGINFRTAYVEDAELVVSHRMIARKYLSKWFAIDFSASIPWELIFRVIQASGGTTIRAALGGGYTVGGAGGGGAGGGGAGGGGAGGDGGGGDVQIVTLIKLLKVPKMLRLGRLLRFLERVEGAANVGRIFILMLIMGVIVHWVR